METLPQFDITKPHGVFNEKRGNESFHYLGQDGYLFDASSHEYIRSVDASATPPPSPVPDAPETDPNAITCKLCGKTYKLGPTEATAAMAQRYMKNHLAKKHQINV